MPLQKQLVPLTFISGLDTKDDDFSTQFGKLSILENGLFTAPGRINKRNGLTSLSNTIETTQNQILAGEALNTFNDQLLLFNGKKAYSYLTSGHWMEKGDVSCCINDSVQVIRNNYTQSNPDMASVGGLNCYAWEDERGGVRYSVIDAETGTFIVADNIISIQAETPKVFALSDQFICTFILAGKISFVRIAIDQPTLLGDIETAASNFTTIFDGYTDLSLYDGCVFDDVVYLAYSAQLNVGEDSFYYTQPATMAISTVDVYPPTHLIGVPTSETLAPSQICICADSGSVNVAWKDTDDDLWIARVKLSEVSALFAVQLDAGDIDLEHLIHLTMIWDQNHITDQISFKIFMDIDNDLHPYLLLADLNVLLLNQIEIVDATELFNLKTRKQISLYSKPFIAKDLVKVVGVHVSEFQDTYFVLDQELNTFSKIHPNVSGGYRGKVLAEVNSTETNIFHVATQIKGKIEAENGLIFTELGVVDSSLSFVSPFTFAAQTIGNNLHVVGGIVQNFDGNKFTEENFNLYPENLSNDSSIPLVQLITAGTPISKQHNRFYLVPAARIRPGDYFLLKAANSASLYCFWFRVDDQGTEPNIPGYSNVDINLSSYMTTSEVAHIIYNVMQTFPEFTVQHFVPAGLTDDGNWLYLDFTNTSNSFAFENDGLQSPVIGFGEIDSGTYQYSAIWKYIDNAGRVHRSTTAIPLEVTFVDVAGVASNTIIVPLLDLTNKADVVLEVYRTINLGTEFRKVGSIFNVKNDDPLVQYLYFIDTMSDEDLQNANEFLYTEGQLDNQPPPPCSIMTIYKNRMWIAGMDNKNLIQYSKTITPEDHDFAVGFNDALFIELDPAGGPITALCNLLDEKLIVFKRDSIWLISGDGANNAGGNVNLSEPILVSSDTGCSVSNSIVTTPIGIMFKSPKGIYLLDRGLNVSYLGAMVEGFNDLTVTSATLMPTKNQVRFTTSSETALVYDYYSQQWTTFTNYAGVDSLIYQDRFVLLRDNGTIDQENDVFDDNGEFVKLAVATSYVSMAGLQGFQRLYRALILGEYKSPHSLKVSIDYDFTGIFTQFATFNAQEVLDNTYGSGTPYGNELYGGNFLPYQIRIHIAKQKCTSFRIKIEDIQSEDADPGESLSLSGLTLQIGVKMGTNKLRDSLSIGSE